VQAARPHPDEPARLQDLRAHAVLDSEPEADFDELTRLAAALCGTPMALVSLIDEQRQWFKSKVGLALDETPREQAFCAHAILEDGVFEVPDAGRDARFADNPLVTGDPRICFYAGASLVSAAGLPLGTLCVLDRVPRTLSDAQREQLRALAGRVVERLEARRRLRELATPHDSQERTVRLPAGAEHETVRSDLLFTDPGEQPRRCGRFTVLQRIGRGAMATVYSAHDAELDRLVAVKLLHGDGDRDARARVQREAQALARISHPNVVQIFEIGSYGAQMFVAMELVDGPTLTEWRAARPRALAEIVDMYIQAGRGLVASHSAGIIHRDYKADNVIVGRDGRARVADFGLARVLRSPPAPALPEPDPTPAASLEITRAGTIMGTPAYMSPEQHRSAAVDERSDQFNFCAALYEALYGRRPFSGTTLAELSLNVNAGAIDEPRPGDDVPAALHAALMRGLATRPDRRWPSLAELLDRLERLDLGEDRRRRRERRALLGLVVALLVGATGLLLYRLDGAAQGGPADLALVGVSVLALALIGVWTVRATLLADAVHRRMAAIAALALAVAGVGRVIAMLAGYSPGETLISEMLLEAVLFAALACFVRRSWWPLAAVQLAGAAAAVAVHPPAVDAVVIVAALALFARAWRMELQDMPPKTFP
jgi:serine/threonine-protein kinase